MKQYLRSLSAFYATVYFYRMRNFLTVRMTCSTASIMYDLEERDFRYCISICINSWYKLWTWNITAYVMNIRRIRNLLSMRSTCENNNSEKENTELDFLKLLLWLLYLHIFLKNTVTEIDLCTGKAAWCIIFKWRQILPHSSTLFFFFFFCRYTLQLSLPCLQ